MSSFQAQTSIKNGVRMCAWLYLSNVAFCVCLNVVYLCETFFKSSEAICTNRKMLFICRTESQTVKRYSYSPVLYILSLKVRFHPPVFMCIFKCSNARNVQKVQKVFTLDLSGKVGVLIKAKCNNGNRDNK